MRPTLKIENVANVASPKSPIGKPNSNKKRVRFTIERFTACNICNRGQNKNGCCKQKTTFATFATKQKRRAT
jgi:hypothetical protein